MKPFQRFQKLNTEGNLWIYVLSLGKEEGICDNEARRLIFEKFGFLADNFLLKTVLYRLRRQGLIKTERYKGNRAYGTTTEGKQELEKMREFCQGLLQKI